MFDEQGSDKCECKANHKTCAEQVAGALASDIRSCYGPYQERMDAITQLTGYEFTEAEYEDIYDYGGRWFGDWIYYGKCTMQQIEDCHVSIKIFLAPESSIEDYPSKAPEYTEHWCMCGEPETCEAEYCWARHVTKRQSEQ